jgi:hypothetical protein
VTGAVDDYDFVGLRTRFTTGWPWPEDSWGLDPMFGEDGWCRCCGVPKHGQSGSLVVRGSRFPAGPVWMPNWQFDVVCLRADVASEVRSRFRLDLLPVRKPRGEDTGVVQIVAPTTARPWYDEADLAERTRSRHGETGSRCVDCRARRWYAVPDEDLPAARAEASWSMLDVVASPEWFGG